MKRVMSADRHTRRNPRLERVIASSYGPDLVASETAWFHGHTTTVGRNRRLVAITYDDGYTHFRQKEVMMVFTTLDFAERYLLKTEVRTSGSMIDPHHDGDRQSSDGPIAPYHHYADLY